MLSNVSPGRRRPRLSGLKNSLQDPMDLTAQIKASLGDEWLPELYRSKVRVQRTRSYRMEVPARENTAEIQYTLLGIDLKVGRRRFACPDLATARYLRVFARAGCSEFAIPY